MTRENARQILERYRDVDEETGEVYIEGLIVGEYLGQNTFRCQVKGQKYEHFWDMPKVTVRDDGLVIFLPR